MGNTEPNQRKRSLSNDPILEDYRWYWNNVFTSWDNVNTNEHWHPFPLELCEDIEKAYTTKTPFHYKDKIILFDYKSLKHLQILQSNAWRKKLILREKPNNLRISRLSLLNNFSPIRILKEEDYGKLFIREMGILLLKDAFANIQYDPNDEFAHKFMNSRKMLTAKLIRFIFKAYKYRIENLIQGNHYFSFEILKQMLIYDFEHKKSYLKYYLNNLTKENFSSVIIGMLLEENNLYQEIIEFPFNCNEGNIYLTTYYLCLCFALYETKKTNHNEYKAYLVSSENQIHFKPNEYYYHKNLLLASKNGFNGLKELKRNKIIFEITIPKEPGENSYLNQRPFDISHTSIYNDEVVLFSTYSLFYIESIRTFISQPRKNKQISTTIISMRVIQDNLNASIPLMTEGEKSKFGIIEEYVKLTEEQIRSVLYAKIQPRHFKYTRKMTNCISMELYGTEVTKDELAILSSSIELMPNLLSLSLIGSDIKGEGLIVLNKGFNSIPLLKWLNLSFNYFKDEDIAKVQLSLLKQLEFLILRVNQITEIGMIDLASQIKHCSYLRLLDLYDNCIGDAGLNELVKEISSFPHLQSIDLWNCNITNKGFINLLEHLYNHQEIEEIKVKHNPIEGKKIADRLIYSVKTMPRLRMISFNQNNFNSNHIDAIVHDYQMINPQWKYHSNIGILSIDSCNSDSNNDKFNQTNRNANLFWLKPSNRLYKGCILKVTSIRNLYSILNNISRYINVKELHLEDAQIGNEGIDVLSDIITKLTLLNALVLSFNNISLKGIECLSPRLNVLENLKTIDMTSNELGDEGVKALALGLSNCPLQELILSWNKISSKGIKELITQANIFKHLLVLDLFGNYISDEGVEAISLNSHHFKELTTLNLGMNRIGNQGMVELAECFNNFYSLINLNLCDNVFDDQGIQELTFNLSKVLNLQYLNISGNNISKERKLDLIEQGIPSSFIL